MAGYTKYYNLKKPEQSENYNVDDANTNNTIIDTVLWEKVDKTPGKGLSENDFTNKYKQKIDMLQKIYSYKGSVASLAKLNEITGQKSGDIYNVISANKDYAWNGEEWGELGTAVDLSGLATPADLETAKTVVKNELETEINSHVEHRYILVLTANVAKGGTITIPAYYKVRSQYAGCLLHGRKTAIKQRRCRHRRTLSRNRHS